MLYVKNAPFRWVRYGTPDGWMVFRIQSGVCEEEVNKSEDGRGNAASALNAAAARFKVLA